MKTKARVTVTRMDELATRDSVVGVGYIVKGKLMRDINLGDYICVDRSERNGVKVPGIFSTSLVTSIEFLAPDIAEVRTANSVYRVEVRGEETV